MIPEHRTYFATLSVGLFTPGDPLRVDLYSTDLTALPGTPVQELFRELLRSATEFYQRQDLAVLSWNILPAVLD